jgi:uncharacterized damage-inducible protein DinB
MAVAPDDKYDWKPSDTSMSLGKLMNHLWTSERGLAEAALNGSFPAERPAPIAATQDLIAAFDRSHEELVAKVSALTPEQLGEDVAPFGPDRKMSRMALLHALNEHEVHHRGQLYVYLRILGCEIPPLYS